MPTCAFAVATRLALTFALGASLCLCAQNASNYPAAGGASQDEELRYVVVISRHGVRSPTGKIDQLNRYSREPWPAWTVPPGYLTEHGAHLMTLMGAYDRDLFASQGLMTPTGCTDAPRVSIEADSDQRTRETGKAIAAGLIPGCAFTVEAKPEGTPDPLFHAMGASIGHPDKKLAAASVSGRIGADPQGLAEAYRPQLQALETILLGCTPGAPCPDPGAPVPHPASLFDIPTSLAPGQGDHLVDFHSPLGTASSMTEDLLLEYTEGMDGKQVGWGRVDLTKLRELLILHTANEDIAQRASYIARAQSSNLLAHILRSMQQSALTQPQAGALGQPGDKLLILVGHDTNLANIAGALNLSWLEDGRRDDTPPGGALFFELWRGRQTGELAVRTYFVAQTLDQMRKSVPLSLANPPARVPVFIPACGRADGSCAWSAFQQALQSAIDPSFVAQ